MNWKSEIVQNSPRSVNGAHSFASRRFEKDPGNEVAEPIEMNITGTLPSDKLPIFFLKPNLHPLTRVSGGQDPRVYIMID